MSSAPNTKVKYDRLRKAVISFQINLEDYKRIRDGWKKGTPQYEAYDLIVREYRKIIDMLLPITMNTP